MKFPLVSAPEGVSVLAGRGRGTGPHRAAVALCPRARCALLPAGAHSAAEWTWGTAGDVGFSVIQCVFMCKSFLFRMTSLAVCSSIRCKSSTSSCLQWKMQYCRTISTFTSGIRGYLIKCLASAMCKFWCSDIKNVKC